MRKHAISVFTAAGIICAGIGLSACHQKQSAGDQMKQGAQEMGQGLKQGASQAGQAVSDSTITAKVKTKLAANQGLSSFEIHVDTNNGVVTLTGTVANGTERRMAGNIASNTDGVKGVDNQITVKPAGG